VLDVDVRTAVQVLPGEPESAGLELAVLAMTGELLAGAE
jgi:hypothetical protein